MLCTHQAFTQPSPLGFSLDPLSARSREYLSVTSQLTVDSRNDRAENAQGLGWHLPTCTCCITATFVPDTKFNQLWQFRCMYAKKAKLHDSFQSEQFHWPVYVLVLLHFAFSLTFFSQINFCFFSGHLQTNVVFISVGRVFLITNTCIIKN